MKERRDKQWYKYKRTKKTSMQEPVASKHCIALDGELCYHIPLLYLDYLANV